MVSVCWTPLNFHQSMCTHKTSKHTHTHFSLKLCRNKWKKNIVCDMFIWSVLFADIMLGDIPYVINIIDSTCSHKLTYLCMTHLHVTQFYSHTVKETDNLLLNSLSPSIIWCSLDHYLKPINRHSISLTVTNDQVLQSKHFLNFAL